MDIDIRARQRLCSVCADEYDMLFPDDACLCYDIPVNLRYLERGIGPGYEWDRVFDA